MDNNSFVQQFAFNFKDVILDEIALEGLQGVGFDLLWRRIEKRMSSEVTDKMKYRFWGFILFCEDISLYEIPEPLPYVEVRDRFEIVDETSGKISDPPDPPDGYYEYCPVFGDYGSCSNYSTRTKIYKHTLTDIPYEQVLAQYGDKLVMVASIEERWKALSPHLPFSYLKEMTETHFAFLELIGRGRENGQMTIGNTNITKINKDPKLIFYNRKYLQSLDLVRAVPIPIVTGGRSTKSLLLRLKRFYKPMLLSLPKKGCIHDTVQHLLQQPDYKDACKNIIDKFVTHSHCRKLERCDNIFAFEVLPSIPARKSNSKSICLEPKSEESSDSETEAKEEPKKYQYHVKVSLARQAYERLIEAGLNGLSQGELSYMLGIEYYTARTICRTFKNRNIVKEIFEDKGKQRVARFVAASQAAALSATYAVEEKKFLELADETKQSVAKNKKSEQTSAEPDSEPPKKKAKISKPINDESISDKDLNPDITEIKCLEGSENKEKLTFLSPSKKPTMRQLRYANGILKTIRDKVIISGYQTLNHFAAKESNEPLMDGKCLKTILQKMINGGQIKLMKMSSPFWPRDYNIICAPFVQTTDPLVQSKYKEINLSVLRSKETEKLKKERLKARKAAQQSQPNKDDPMTRPLALSVYPRYLKIQKMHEFIMKHTYFNEEGDNPSPEGFMSLVDLIPEFTFEFVMGNMNPNALAAMSQVKICQSMLQEKLRNMPADLFKTFLATAALQNAWRLNLKVLSTLGLLQLIKNETSSEENVMLTYEFYVNRYASIIDTTGVWPRADADVEALRKEYEFKTMGDVEKYWTDVHQISINTEIKLEPSERSRKKPQFFVPRRREDVHKYDNRQIYGNGRGPCGFDSSFFMDMPKLWMQSHTKLKHHGLLKKPLKLPVKRKRVNKPKPKKNKSYKKKVQPPVNVEADGNGKKKKRHRPSAPKWSIEEDRLLMLCKAAMTVISPTAHPGALRLRNLVAKDILSILDPKKTASYCHKRSKMLETNTTLAYDKDCVINELRRYPHILRKYEGLFRMLRLQYCGNIPKLLASSRLPMLEVVMILLRIMKSESFRKKTPCVALNLADFHNNYKICPSTVNRNYNSYKTPVESGPVLAAIKEGIIIAVMTTYKINQTPEIARLIHAMFSVYPEHTLRPAIEQLRKCGAVAAREKILNTASHNFHFQDVAQSSFKVSMNYTRHWICKLNSDFADNLMFSMDEDIPKVDLKGYPETNCLAFELQAIGAVDVFCMSEVVVTGSEGVMLQQEIDMMTDFKIKPAPVGLTIKNNITKASLLYEGIDYKAPLQRLTRDSVLRKSPSNINTDEDEIVAHLQTKLRLGSSLAELQQVTGLDRQTILTRLEDLESKNVVKRLGYYDNLIVLTKYAKQWTLTSKDTQFVPSPWFTLDLDIRNDIFVKWAGVIVSKVCHKPGCSIAGLTEEEFLTARAALDICMVLEKYKCIEMKTLRVPEPDLFSEDMMPEVEEFSPYDSPENIHVFATKDMLIRYAYFRKKLLDDEYYFEKS